MSSQRSAAMLRRVAAVAPIPWAADLNRLAGGLGITLRSCGLTP